MWLVAFVLLSKLEHDPQVHRVHTLELNNVYKDDWTGHAFSQWIFRDRDQNIIDWRFAKVRIIKPACPPDPAPTAVWWEFDVGGVLRKTPGGWRLSLPKTQVRAELFVQTGSNYDIEVAERKVLPVARRRRIPHALIQH